MSPDPIIPAAGEQRAAATPPGIAPRTAPKKDSIIKRLINKIRLILQRKPTTTTRPSEPVHTPFLDGATAHGTTN